MLGEIHYREPWIHFPRTINEYVLYFIRDGEMFLRENGEEYHLKVGDFFLLEPGFLHEGVRPSACSYIYAHFTHPDMGRVQDDAAAMEDLEEKRKKSLLSYNLDREDPTDPITYLPKHFHTSGGDFLSLLHGAIMCYDGREEHYKRRAASILHTFFLQISHEHLQAGSRRGKLRRSQVTAQQLLHYLNQNYAQHLSGNDIAQKFGVNFDYINRVFSEMTGSTIFTYLNNLRIYQAKQLIATTDLSFSEIADRVGIEDHYYFSKLFRKITGLSPTQYYKEGRSR